ncbi:MAG: hypothetical protein ACKVW3_14700 [Phycisphaerales bacterium]
MTLVNGVILIFTALALLGLMIAQARKGTVDLFSTRNLFIIGIIIFQCVSGWLSMFMLDFGEVNVENPTTTGFIYTGLLLVFIALFLLSYHKGWFVRTRAWRASPDYPQASPGPVLAVATVLLVVGLIFRLVIGRTVPILGVLTDMMGIGLLSASAGLAAWVWVPRLMNPAVMIPAATIILVGMLSLVLLTFGRRDVLSLIITVFFAGYMSRWRHMGWAKMAPRVIVVGAAALLFMSAFSTVRSATSKKFDIGDLLSKLMEANVSEGLLGMATGQFAAANSMWVIENRPEPFPFNPLHSAVYTIVQPVPRVLLDQFGIPKPNGLGYEMVREARVYKYQKEFTLGPGIVGHIWNDNPILALVPYAVFFGLVLRYLDEYAAVHPFNPYYCIPIVAGAGDMVGIPRGEVGLFLFRTAMAVLAAWVGLRIARRVLLRSFGATPLIAPDSADAGEWHEGEYSDVPESSWTGERPA